MDTSETKTAGIRVLENLRKMTEPNLHRTVITPLLEELGASHIRYLHGPQERGKDFSYVVNDIFGNPCLEVCQVKNGPLSGRSKSTLNTVRILNQLIQCRTTEVWNPVTQLKERPASIVLLTTYPLPDKDIADTGQLLREIREGPFKVIGPERLAALLEKHLPRLFQELAFPGDRLARSIVMYVNTHHEASAFNVEPDRMIEDFFVDLGMAKGIEERDEGDMGSKALSADEIERAESLQSVLPPTLRSFRIVQENARNPREQINGEELLDFLEEYEHLVRKSSSSTDALRRAEALSLMQRTGAFLSCIARCLAHHESFLGTFYSQERKSRLATGRTSPSDFLYTENNLCFVGDAGAGKTSLARMIARKAVENGIRCIYFPCAMIRKKSERLQSSIASFIKRIAGYARAKQMTLDGISLVILDGCDEAATFGRKIANEIRSLAFAEPIESRVDCDHRIDVAVPKDLRGSITYDAESRTLQLIKPISVMDFDRLAERNRNSCISDAVCRLMQEYRQRNPRVILTTRTSARLLPIEGFTTFSLLPFDDEQLLTFYKKWFRASPESCKPIMNFLEHNAYVKEIARVPMIATLIATLYENSYDLPRSRSEIYVQRFDLLLRKWDIVKGIASRSVFRADDKLIILRRLALRLHEHHRRSFGVQDIADLWDEAMYELYPDHSVEDLLWELAVVNNVIGVSGGREYSLGHLSYQEFLAAGAIMHGQMQHVLVSNVSDPWWRNVLLFFAGLCADIGSFLAEIQESDPLSDRSGLLEAMIKEARFTSPAVRDFMRDIPPIRTRPSSARGIVTYIFPEGGSSFAKVGLCPVCEAQWDLRQEGPTCRSCKNELGKDFVLLQKGDSCPYCKQGYVAPNHLACKACGLAFQASWIRWDIEY